MRPPGGARAGLGLAVAAAAAACAPSPIALPDAPHKAQMDTIAAVYESPTGTIDVAQIQTTLDAVDARLAEMHLDWLPDLVAEALMGITRRLSDADEPTDPDAGIQTDHVIIDAVIDLNRVCRGWSDPPGPPDAAANGTVHLTAVIDEGILRPDVWGSASACRTRLDPIDGASALIVMPSVDVNLSVDGSLDIRLYGPLPRSVGEAKFLLLFSGRLGADDLTTDASFDFRVLDGHFDFRLAVSDGDIIVGVDATSISLRASNATFVCDLASRSCQ